MKDHQRVEFSAANLLARLSLSLKPNLSIVSFLSDVQDLRGFLPFSIHSHNFLDHLLNQFLKYLQTIGIPSLESFHVLYYLFRKFSEFFNS